MMAKIPRDLSFDGSRALLFSEGYEFISNRCRRFGSDIFATRVMLRKAICMQGAEAAEQFYYPGRFTRRGAMPLFALTLIQDLGSVMVMDGEDHRRRKEMFLSLMSPEAIARLAERTSFYWRNSVREWKERKKSFCSTKPMYRYAPLSVNGSVSSSMIERSDAELWSSKP
jgi:fatty-acid peroxygenase